MHVVYQTRGCIVRGSLSPPAGPLSSSLGWGSLWSSHGMHLDRTAFPHRTLAHILAHRFIVPCKPSLPAHRPNLHAQHLALSFVVVPSTAAALCLQALLLPEGGRQPVLSWPEPSSLCSVVVVAMVVHASVCPGTTLELLA